MDIMDVLMLTMDTTMARDLLMLRPMLMPSMVTMDMVLPTTVMDTMDMPIMDTMDILMLTMDTIMARDLLMPMLMLTMDITHMPMLMDTMDMPIMGMPTMDIMDTHMLTDTTDIINLFIFVKDLRSLLPCEMGCS